MKIQNILRIQAIAIGLAAAVLLTASPVRSQEIVNTEFPDGPYVAPFTQPTTAAAAVSTAVPASTTPDANAVTPAIAVATPVVTDQAVVSLAVSTERALLAAALFAIALLAAYAIAEVRRASRIFPECPSSRLHRRATVA